MYFKDQMYKFKPIIFLLLKKKVNRIFLKKTFDVEFVIDKNVWFSYGFWLNSLKEKRQRKSYKIIALTKWLYCYLSFIQSIKI